MNFVVLPLPVQNRLINSIKIKAGEKGNKRIMARQALKTVW